MAEQAGLRPGDYESVGAYRAKVRARAPDEGPLPHRGRLVLVTAMTPGHRSVGKTVTAIGLGMALSRTGRGSIVNLRQSALGPTLGSKGGGAGGGEARVEPFVECLLGLGADTFAVESAHNLLAAVLDDSLHRGSDIDPTAVSWRRVVDMDDRSLRQIRIGLGRVDGPARDTGFDITAASEVMAILTLSAGPADLRRRLGAVVAARDRRDHPVTAEDLGAAGAMAALLRDALAPNLFQTSEGTPVLVHTGPFGNLAPGCSSVIADRLALARAEFVVTEAGFGSELGAEKFIHLKAPVLGAYPDAVVLVATVGCLREQGGGPAGKPDVAAVRAGCSNLRRHLEILSAFGLPALVALNRFPDDTPEEIATALSEAEDSGAVGAVVDDAYELGGGGGLALAEAVVAAAAGASSCRPLVKRDASVVDKVETIAARVYGAAGVRWSERARRELSWLEDHGVGRLPVCMAKTHLSLSDDPNLRGAPSGFTLSVTGLRLAAGAGYVTALAGDIATMPGLPARAHFRDIDLTADGVVSGLE